MDVDVIGWETTGPLLSIAKRPSSLACQFARLEVLLCGNIPLRGNALAYFGCSSAVEELCVLLAPDVVSSWSSISLGSRIQARFATLRKSEIRTQDLAVFNDLADCNVMFLLVEIFSIYCASFPSASGVDTSLHALQDRFSPSRLRCLFMETKSYIDQWRRCCGGTLWHEHLCKFLAFCKLRKMKLHAYMAVELNDDIAEEMSAAWPQIEKLCISPQCNL